MLLTDFKIRNARPKSSPYRLSDGEGLTLIVRPNGGKFWQFRYRFLDREKTQSFGKYPRVTLAEAREKKLKARAILSEGHDPSAVQRKNRLLAEYQNANSFFEVAKEWHSRNFDSWTNEHGRRIWQRLSNHAFPSIGARPIAELESLEMLAVIQRIEAQGKTHMARRVLQICSTIFRYAIVTGRAKLDPTYGLKIALRPHREQHYPALSESELGEFFIRLKQLETHPQNRNAFELLLLTALRTGELRHARWLDIDWKERTWSIPAENMKMRRDHLVPLSEQAISRLKQQAKISTNSQWIFPNLQRRKNPVMSEGTILSLIKRMGLKGRLVGHGVRSMFSTILNEHRFDRDVIERQLAHVDSSRVRAAYNRAEYWDDRVKLMQWWADFLDKKRPADESVCERRKHPIGGREVGASNVLYFESPANSKNSL